MSDTLGAILPVFLVIVLGFVLRRGRWVPDSFWIPAENLTYWVTFPALLVLNLAQADLAGLPWGALMTIEAGAVVVVAAGLVLWRFGGARAAGVSDATFTSAFQGAIRPNTYIGLACAGALFGAPGITLTALCLAVVVPLVNLLSVAALVRWGTGQGGGRALLRGILTNPLILGCLVGGLMNASGLGAPPVLGPFLQILGSAALPLGLLAVGAGLSAAGLAGAGPAVAASTLAKLVITPALVFAGAAVAGLDPVVRAVAVLYAALPCSASSYVLARRMGGDAPAMAALITAQTLASALTLPVIVALVAP
ncbi:AEC family transporter [Pararhodospirillum oryzae]|uniref:Transporter n=1 Tax=Pararhodospirillum oryzae TaxID=478448 RepID=A0A512H7E5_9PROT|nr:AEC family transporter [Pararhodospirillum oryzae]GEO81372.1 transporter [Pararhodospirillum oryzae]